MIMKMFRIALLYTLLTVSGSLSAADDPALPPGEERPLGEKVLILGGENGWASVESRQGIVEASGRRPHSVLVLDSARPPSDSPAADLMLSFDEDRPDRFADASGNYALRASAQVKSVNGGRFGTGAVLFSGGYNAIGDAPNDGPGPEPLVISPLRPEALLAPGSRFSGFSLEFWINPANMETGEQILHWSAVRSLPQGGHEAQWIQCVASRNRFEWNFHNFFVNSRDDRQLSAALSGVKVISPEPGATTASVFTRIRASSNTSWTAAAKA
jgi:hypothetical protein